MYIYINTYIYIYSYICISYIYLHVSNIVNICKHNPVNAVLATFPWNHWGMLMFWGNFCLPSWEPVNFANLLSRIIQCVFPAFESHFHLCPAAQDRFRNLPSSPKQSNFQRWPRRVVMLRCWACRDIVFDSGPRVRDIVFMSGPRVRDIVFMSGPRVRDLVFGSRLGACDIVFWSGPGVRDIVYRYQTKMN